MTRFVYLHFTSHTTQTAHWLDPRIAALQRAGQLQPADGIQGCWCVLEQ